MKTGITTAGSPGRMRELSSRRGGRLPFFLTLLYLFFEYGRPQALFPPLSVLHLPALTAIMLTAFLFLRGKVRFEETHTWLFALLLGLMVIHGPIAVNNYWALLIFITMSMNFIIYISIIQFVDKNEKYIKLVHFWVIIHIFLAIVGFVRKGQGIGGFLGDENDLCMTLNMIVPLTCFLALSASKNLVKLYFLAITCLFVFVVIITESRGGFVGLTTAGVYIFLRSKKKVLVGMIISLLAVFVLVTAPASYWEEVRSITREGTTEGTGSERIWTWTIGWGMFLDNPVIGVGQGNFPWEFRKYEIEAGFEEGLDERSRAGRAAHSIYFTLLPELGLVGTILFFAIVWYTLKEIKYLKKNPFDKKGRFISEERKRTYYFGLALEGGLITYLVCGIFISTLYYPNLWILIGMVSALRRIVELEYNKEPVRLQASSVKARFEEGETAPDNAR